jgi:hypothetical protein
LENIVFEKTILKKLFLSLDLIFSLWSQNQFFPKLFWENRFWTFFLSIFEIPKKVLGKKNENFGKSSKKRNILNL